MYRGRRLRLLGCQPRAQFCRARGLGGGDRFAPGCRGGVFAKYHVAARDWSEALADPAIDAVAIAAPAEQHARMVTEALEAGKHVFVEKPLALRHAEGARLVGEAERRGLVLMVGHLLQYHPAFIYMRDLVREGALGRLRYVYSNRLNFGKVRREENILWSFAPHDISMILAWPANRR